MTAELILQGNGIEQRRVSITEAIARLLPMGHAIHGYSSADNTRVIKVLGSREYSDGARLLGYGEDGSAERALARALITYALREQQQLDYIQAGQFPESTQGQIFLESNESRFDTIVWSGDFALYQDGDDVVAASSYGDYPRGPLAVRAEDPLAAITALTNRYNFMNDTVKLLPAISLA